MARTLAGGACLILLAGYAQSVNLNHGATPGMNRWTLWLLPWLLLFAQPRANGARNKTPAGQVLVRRVWVVLAVLNVLWGAWFFRPSLPENYRYPTAMASWLWTHAAGWYAPAPEIFAERASHREPAPLPVAWTGCTKVLIIDGRWPAACVPTAPVPADCLGADRLCYATPPLGATSPALTASAAASEPSALDPSAGLTTFTPLGIARFPWVPARSWPSGAPFVAALREQLAAAAAREPDSRALDADPAVVRAATDVGWTTAWRGQSSLVIYVEGATANAVLELRIDADYEGWLIDLDAPVDARADRLRDTRPDGHRDSDSVRGCGATAAPLTLARSGERPSVMPLPFSVEHGLLLLTRKPPLQ